MGVLSWIGRLMRPGSRSFSDYERKVLEAVALRLPPDAAERLTRRIEEVNLVQRLDGGREVNCYSIKGGRVVVNPDSRIESSTGERMLARFQVRGGQLASNEGEVWLVDGSLFSIEFRDSTEHAEPKDVVSIAVELAAAEQLLRGAASD